MLNLSNLTLGELTEPLKKKTGKPDCKPEENWFGVVVNRLRPKLVTVTAIFIHVLLPFGILSSPSRCNLLTFQVKSS